MIEIYHVSKSYNGKPALQDVSLSIKKGEFVYLTGSSGAGKTTLLRLIFRAEAPDEGHIVVNSRDLGNLTESAVPYLRRSMGFIFQDFRLLPKKTVFENVAVTLRVVGLSETVIRRKVLGALQLVGLESFQDAHPSMLSAGGQQRVCLARAIVNDPVILLADEPTSNLDTQLAGELLELLKVVNLRGTTIMLATHNTELVRRLQRRVVTLNQGCVVENGVAQA
jgi:cell division transport system ATP-binding protein